MNITQALQQATQQLANDTAHLDASILLAYVLKTSRLNLLLNAKDVLTHEQLTVFNELISRRQQGIPVAYLTGKKEFWSFELAVTADTLVPRPETELLVEAALRLCPAEAQYEIADLGTGSGAIALALAQERPRCSITAVDQSERALQIAQQNAKHYQLTNITFLQSNWFGNLHEKKFHLIVSNPPYLAADDLYLKTNIRYEPQSALVADAKGLADIEHLIAESPRYLFPDGWLLLEHGFAQASAVTALFQQHNYTAIQTLPDFSGHERVTFARFS